VLSSSKRKVLEKVVGVIVVTTFCILFSQHVVFKMMTVKHYTGLHEHDMNKKCITVIHCSFFPEISRLTYQPAQIDQLY